VATVIVMDFRQEPLDTNAEAPANSYACHAGRGGLGETSATLLHHVGPPSSIATLSFGHPGSVLK
jgi:hypothetical protein